jgi:hypothetical protein
MSNALRWQVNTMHAAMHLKEKELVCSDMKQPEHVRTSDGA